MGGGGSWVWGLEADATWLNLSETSTFVAAPTGAPTFLPGITTTQETKTDWLATFRARAGFALAPESLLYATAGFAAGHVEGTTSLTPSGGSLCAINSVCSTGSGSETLWGWTVGGGIEHAIASHWSAKLEYLYYDLGDFSYTANEISPAFPAFAGDPNLRVDTDVTGQILRFGVNYRF